MYILYLYVYIFYIIHETHNFINRYYISNFIVNYGSKNLK